MGQDTDWKFLMLHKLYKKLYVMFVCAMMLIITTIIGIVCFNTIHIEKMNQNAFFQRMTMLLIYQLEDNNQPYDVVLKTYEEKYSLAGNMKDENGTIIYHGDSRFLTSTDYLINELHKQVDLQQTITLQDQTTTLQGATFEIQGLHNDSYWGIPSTIVSKNDHIYSLLIFYQQPSFVYLLQQQLFFFTSIWILSFLCVLISSYWLLKKAFQPTEKILKSQKEFIASASHELKSPLAVIVANTEELRRDLEDHSKIVKPLTIIDSESMRMSKLIKDMLVLASCDAQTWTIQKQDVHVDLFLINVYETYEPACRKAHITLHLDLGDQIYPVLNSDSNRMFQILSIFIDNAIHYAKHTEHIEIKTIKHAKHISFYIIDHGQGIPNENKPFLFHRFFCGDKSHSDKSHFGLGLSIADELATMLNGKVGFYDTQGGGATFYFTLPLK